MAIYITRNGQKYGPYSLTEAQEHVRSGNLTMSDLAWHEGLPNWIPLNQIPGFTFVRPAAPVAPVATTTPEALHRSPAQNKSFLQKAGTGIVAIGVLLLKFAGPLLIFLKTGGSMLLSIFVYSAYFHWSWQLATAIVVLIFVHEMGHVIAAKWLGMPVSAPLFIPFLGASIVMKQSPRDAWTEALMAYGGPLAGCIGSWICWCAAFYVDWDWLMPAATISFIINLFNMIPIPPLDGGRICAAVSPWFWIIGLLLLGASIVLFHAWNSFIIIGLVLLMALPRMKQILFGQTTPEMQAYYNTHISNRLTMALMYLGLIAALLLGYWDASSRLSALMNNS
jgi:Zn-dependent protease